MGKYDDITGKTVDKIWNLIHDVERENKNGVLYRRIHKNTRQLKFKLRLDVGMVSVDSEKEFEIDAGAYTDLKMPIIELRIEINSNFGKKSYCRINSRLNDVIRHEIEHLLQAGINRKKGKTMPTLVLRYRAETSERGNVSFNYLKLRDEVPANIFGMYRQAKIEKKPITLIFEEYLDEYIRESDLKPEQAKLIYKKWYKYSKKYLPKAKYATTKYT
jgi:hypothetical protein